MVLFVVLLAYSVHTLVTLVLFVVLLAYSVHTHVTIMKQSSIVHNLLTRLLHVHFGLPNYKVLYKVDNYIKWEHNWLCVISRNKLGFLSSLGMQLALCHI